MPVQERRQELKEILVKCYKGFYLRPKFIARGLSRIRGLGELKRKMRAGLSVVTMRPDEKVFDKALQDKIRDVVPDSPIEVHY